MARIYEDDQKVRQDGFAARPDWDAIEKADRVRRERVAALLAAGALHTADDYRKAAFVFHTAIGRMTTCLHTRSR